MQSIDPRPPLIVILGPTAVGKTELALQLTERLDGEIISADSRLFYRGMDIGTAKPTVEERQRVPHHLIDVAAPVETWSLVQFQAAARQAISETYTRGRLPFLVGGTGQYIRAVVEDWEVPQQSPDENMRLVLEKWGKDIGAETLHAKLASIDPEAAERIEPRNLRRTVRALEVIFLTGKKFSEQRRRSESPYALLQLGIRRPRADLYLRIDERIDAMMRAGLVNEVKDLLAKGYSAELPTLSAIGYREIIDYLLGKSTLDEAVMLIKRSTRQFVRRQGNWFKENDPSIQWFDIGPDTIHEMEDAIQRWVKIHPIPVDKIY